MKDKLRLNNFEYSIVPSAMIPETPVTDDAAFVQQLPLLNVRVDFKKGIFNIEGDWKYMVAANRHAERNWYSFHKGRVKVEALLRRGLVINIDDQTTDGMVFPFKGKITDGNSTGSCSGLLVINNDEKDRNGHSSIVLYLYHYQVDSCEIIFKLPVYAQGINADLN